MRLFVSNFTDCGIVRRLHMLAALVMLGGVVLGANFAAAADNRDTLVLRGYVPERTQVVMQVADNSETGELARIAMRSNFEAGAELRLEADNGKLPRNLTIDGRPIAAERGQVRLNGRGGVLALSDREAPDTNDGSSAAEGSVTLVVSAR